jgi:acyl-CoA thioesterase FadM
MASPAPFVSRVLEVEKDWIDYNGHMNMAYYNVLFDRCADEAFELLGMGPKYAGERRLTTYTAEIHVCYVRELHLGDKVTCTFHMLDHDEKRFHPAYPHERPEGLRLSARHPCQHRGHAGRTCKPASSGARGPLDRHPPQGRLTAPKHADTPLGKD